MAQSSQQPFTHIPASQDTSKQLIKSEGVALAVGFVASAVGIVLGYHALGEFWKVISHFVTFLVAAYLAALSIQFWLAKPYQNGMTSKEIFQTVLWPIGAIRAIRLGAKAMAGKMPTSSAYSATGDKVISKSVALIAGVVLTIVSVIMLFVGIHAAVGVVWHLVWLAVLVYIIGGIVQFWVAQSWREGLTVKELTMAAIWPVGMASTIRAGVKYFRQP